MSQCLLLPDIIFDGERMRRGLGLLVGADGAVIEVRAARAGDAIIKLTGRALIPGFINAHSHAFQRAMRGRTQKLDPARPTDDFWSWRGAMYETVTSLDLAALEAISAFAFAEMLAAGYTSVAEFHYLSRLDGAGAGAGDGALATERAVLGAAARAGIRMTLARVGYFRGGFAQEASAAQQRFILDERAFAADARALAAHLQSASAPSTGGDARVRMALGAHSVRAADRRALVATRSLARELGVPFHIHVAEQPREVQECLREHGKRPIELLLELGMIDRDVILVHCNHASAAEIAALAALGDDAPTICICPTTEADLGDGLAPSSHDPSRLATIAGQCWRLGIRLAIGSDSQALIDPFAEMRGLEFLERTVARRRIVLDPIAALHARCCAGGARALGVEVGRLAPGLPADAVAVDLEHPLLIGIGDDELMATIMLAGSPALVADVFVAGERVVQGGRHREIARLSADYQSAIERIQERR